MQAEAPHNCEMHHDCGDWVGGRPFSRGAGQDHRDNHSLEEHPSEIHCAQSRLQHRMGNVPGCSVPCQLQRPAGHHWQQPGMFLSVCLAVDLSAFLTCLKAERDQSACDAQPPRCMQVQYCAHFANGAGVSLIMAYLNGNSIPDLLSFRSAPRLCPPIHQPCYLSITPYHPYRLSVTSKCVTLQDAAR